MQNKVAWNKNKDASVVLAKLKEFTIRETGDRDPEWSLRGWFNETNFFSFGSFDTKEEAQLFLNNIHGMF